MTFTRNRVAVLLFVLLFSSALSQRAYGDIINVEGDTGNWLLDLIQVINPGPPLVNGLPTLRLIETALDNGPFDLDISVVGTGGQVMQIAVIKNILNSTGVDWDDMHFELGTGLGGAFEGSDNIDDLQFLLDPNPFSNFFANHSFDGGLERDTIWWDKGLHPNGQTGTYAIGIELRLPPNGIGRFTLRQTPSKVPAPGCIVLLLVGGALVGRNRERSHCVTQTIIPV